MRRNDYDVWSCECGHRWTTTSVPHDSTCPKCGRHGWWQKFEKGIEYEVELGSLRRGDS